MRYKLPGRERLPGPLILSLPSAIRRPEDHRNARAARAPGGKLGAQSSSSSTSPDPLQSGHEIVPVPWHSRHSRERGDPPVIRTDSSWSSSTTPRPSHFGQLIEPFPPQRAQLSMPDPFASVGGNNEAKLPRMSGNFAPDWNQAGPASQRSGRGGTEGSPVRLALDCRRRRRFRAFIYSIRVYP